VQTPTWELQEKHPSHTRNYLLALSVVLLLVASGIAVRYLVLGGSGAKEVASIDLDKRLLHTQVKSVVERLVKDADSVNWVIARHVLADDRVKGRQFASELDRKLAVMQLQDNPTARAISQPRRR
jgi:hypothetical protein